MRICRECGRRNVAHKTGPSTCVACRQAKYRLVKERYRHSPKGRATERAREEREDVREKRRLFSRSQQGRKNKAKYEATAKGRASAKRKAEKYAASEHGKAIAAAKHQRTKNQPKRRAQRQTANAQYRVKRRALLKNGIVTAEDWLQIVAEHKGRCHYCRKRRKLTMDHVIPLSKGGEHTRANIVPACLSCNSQKRDKLIRLL